jgi:hypothetical protein
MLGLILGKCQNADANQQVAEAHPVISAAVSMSDLMIHSNYSGKDGDSPKEACQ